VRRIYALPRVRLYLLGSGISFLGDFALWLALAIWAKQLTGSSSAAGLVFFAITIGGLTSPITSVLVDRYRRKPLLLITYLVTAVVVLAVAFVHDRGQVWLIYLVMLLVGVSGGISQSAQTALLPQLVDADLLGEANGVLQLQQQGLRLVTPLVGAGLYAWLGGTPVAIIDAATFVIATALLAMISVDEAAPAPPADRHWTSEFTAGVRHLFRVEIIRQQTLAIAATMLVFGFFESVGFAVTTVGLHRAPSYIGVLICVQGAGAIVGGATTGRLIARFSGGLVLAAGMLVMAGSCVLQAAPNLTVVLIACVMYGIGFPWIVAGYVTTVQRNTPTEVMGRVAGAYRLLVTGPQAVSMALGAALLAVIFYRDLLYVMAVVMLGSAIYLATRHAQRPIPARPVPVAPAPEEAEVTTGS
jgi:MFS family permease